MNDQPVEDAQASSQARRDALIERFDREHPGLADAMRTVGLAEEAYAGALAGLVEPTSVVAANTTAR